jgi:hypothetical protein
MPRRISWTGDRPPTGWFRPSCPRAAPRGGASVLHDRAAVLRRQARLYGLPRRDARIKEALEVVNLGCPHADFTVG